MKKTICFMLSVLMLCILMCGCSNEKIKVGDSVSFGNYEQDNDYSNGDEKIEWIVLEVIEDRALLISKHIIDYLEFHKTNKAQDFTWETSTIRRWLNNSFIDFAFSDEEAASVLSTVVEAHANPGSNPFGVMADQGKNTTDKVFLLSIQEAEKYFKKDSKRKAKITDFALAQKSYIAEDDGYACWWLRTSGYLQTNATFVEYDGNVNECGEGWFASAPAYGIRPAIWVEVSALQK